MPAPRFAIGVALAALLLPAAALTQQPKIGVVDVQKAVMAIPAGKAAKTQLEKEAKKMQADLDGQQERLKKMKDELERQAALLQEAVKRQKMREYQQLLMTLQEAFIKNQQDLKEKEVKLLKPILSKLETAIEKVAKADGYHLVLEKGEARVLYNDPAMDITDQVVSNYGK